MVHFLESERIYLREVRESDINDNYYEWMNDPEVTQYLETRFHPQSMDDLYDYFIDHERNPDEPWFAICLKRNDDHIGNIKLGPINWIHRRADISLFIGEKSFWGKGYGTEAINLVSRYSFDILGLHKLCAGIYIRYDGFEGGNWGSLSAFERNGFKSEAILKSHVFSNGKWLDLELMGKING